MGLNVLEVYVCCLASFERDVLRVMPICVGSMDAAWQWAGVWGGFGLQNIMLISPALIPSTLTVVVQLLVEAGVCE